MTSIYGRCRSGIQQKISLRYDITNIIIITLYYYFIITLQN